MLPTRRPGRSLIIAAVLAALSLAAVAATTAAAQTCTLSVQSMPPAGLSVGSTTGHSGVTSYALPGLTPGASVNLQAPATDPTGYTFSQWTLNGAAQPQGQKSIAFTVLADTTAVAEYVSSPYTLFVQSTPPTALSISSSTGHSGVTDYSVTGVIQGTSVILQAPATDLSGSYTFSQWTLNGVPQPSGQQSITFTMAANATAVALYTPGNYTLTVQSTPPAGLIVGSSTGHNGVTSYAVTGLTATTSVNLQAPATDPSALYPFSMWTLNGVPQPSGQQAVTFTLNADTAALAVYASGNLSITLTPAAAVTAGTQWNVDGGAWQDSAATVAGLSVGQHTVNYQAVTGWNPPAAEQVGISSATTTSLTRNYTQQTGGIMVTLAPAGAIAAGAQWNIDGGAWQDSGTTVYNVIVGNHTVYYKPATGWNAPASEQVSVANNLATDIGPRNYVQQTGGVQVTLGPVDAMTAGAEWNVDGGPWQISGVTVTGIAVGSHTVNFNTLPDWNSPASQPISVSYLQTTVTSGTYVLQTGSVQVTLAPAAAITAGAEWNVDGGAWLTSGATVGGLSLGVHTINYNTVPNWNSPLAASPTIAYNATTGVTGTYAEQTGSLQVTLGPAGAITAGAQWNVDGGAWQASGATVSGLFIGASHTINYNTIPGWNSPSSASPVITYNNTTTATGAYVQQTGSLQVTLGPADAVTAGAQWNVDGGAWQLSGATVTGLPIGAHTVNYNTITNWNSPTTASPTITYNGATSITGTYVLQTGSVQVTLAPADAVTAGARWNVDGGAWQVSAATVSGLTLGVHTVNYNTITNWNSPATASPAVTYNATASVAGTYVQQTGSLQVTLGPADAITAGAQWNVDGGAWQLSGAIVSGLFVGAGHTINYNTVTGWNSPSTAAPVITYNNTTAATGTYVQQTGSLKVTLAPAGAITAGARWNVDGGAWQISGATVTGLPIGSHTINFNTITNWNSPATASPTVTYNGTASTTGTYVLQTGSVQVMLAPPDAVTAGAQWNVDGGAWQTSGSIVSGLTLGAHTINYNTVSGWNSPASDSPTITYNATASVTGTYAQQTGNLTVTILPSAAVTTGGAMWNVDGGAWQSSASTVTGLSVGSHTLNFLPITGWAAPAGQPVAIANNQTTSKTGTYVGDSTPPAVTNLLPGLTTWSASNQTLISLDVTDAGSGVDPARVIVSAGFGAGGNPPTTWETLYSGASWTANSNGWYSYDASANPLIPGAGCCIGTRADYRIVFQPSAAFDYEDALYIRVNAADQAGNIMSPYTYNFPIEARAFGLNVRVDGGTAGNAFPAAATDAAGNIWVAWERTDPVAQTGAIWLAERPVEARNFNPEIQVTTAGDCHKPSIAITPGGTIYVAYEVHGATPSVGVATATTAAPATWTAVVGPVTGLSFALQNAPAITVSSAGATDTVTVAGSGADAGSIQQIGIGAWSTGAANWTVAPITSSAQDQISPAIAQDSTGLVYVVWTSTADHNLYGADSSASWAPIHAVTADGTAGAPAIATEATGNILHFAWADTGDTVNPDILYAETTGGWSGTPLPGKTVLDETSGINDAANPRIAVTGTTASGANAGVFIVWQDRRSSTPGDTSILFVERKRDGHFGTNLNVNRIVAGPGILANAPETNPAIGLTKSGAPCAAWTDLRETDAPHIYFAAAMQPVPLGLPCAAIAPTGGAGACSDGSNPHFTAVDLTVPANAFVTPRSITISEVHDPVIECTRGSGFFADGSGLYLDMTGGLDETLGAWVTVTVHLTQAEAVTLKSPVTVYRLVPPATPLDGWSWTTALVRNANYDSTGRVLTFEVMHLSTFGVSASASSGGGGGGGSSSGGGGGGGGGGCAMSRNGEPDLLMLLLPFAALAAWAATRRIGGKHSSGD